MGIRNLFFFQCKINLFEYNLDEKGVGRIRNNPSKIQKKRCMVYLLAPNINRR